MTKLMFYEHPDLLEGQARVKSCDQDEKGAYLILDQTLFYPQGGGQPADQGELVILPDQTARYRVKDVRTVEGQVRHYLDLASTQGLDVQPDLDMKSAQTQAPERCHPLNPADLVLMKVDAHRRSLNSRYHTAGHLIAALAEALMPELKATKGHQFPSEAYIELEGIVPDAAVFLDQLTKAVQKWTQAHVPVFSGEALEPISQAENVSSESSSVNNQNLRVCHIEGFSPIPCGGTHVSSLQEIGLIQIQECKSKKGKTKIRYEVLDR